MQTELSESFNPARPQVSIITPSFRASNWLRLCVASVADQGGVTSEHIIQDACSDDGTQDWLPHDRRVKAFVEKDTGMYDAINRGLRRSEGQICAYLNCDEQYVPGALAQVAAAFAKDSKVDILFANTIIVDQQGQYICSRPALRPVMRDLKVANMYNLSCSMFFRRDVFDRKGLFFNPQLRIVGDLEWLRRAMEMGLCVKTINVLTSVFFDLGTNLALSAAAKNETEAARDPGGLFRRLVRPLIIAAHRLRRFRAGHYHLRPFEYSIYTLDNDKNRQTFRVAKPTGVWRNRL